MYYYVNFGVLIPELLSYYMKTWLQLISGIFGDVQFLVKKLENPQFNLFLLRAKFIITLIIKWLPVGIWTGSGQKHNFKTTSSSFFVVTNIVKNCNYSLGNVAV